MALSSSSFLSFFFLLSLTLTSANRLLKEPDPDADADAAPATELISKDKEPHFHADFARHGIKGLPINAVGSSTGCSSGNANCGQYGCSQSPYNGCSGGSQSCGNFGGSCQSCSGGCQSCGNYGCGNSSGGCQSCGNYYGGCGNFGACQPCYSPPPCQSQGTPSCGCATCIQGSAVEAESKSSKIKPEN